MGDRTLIDYVFDGVGLVGVALILLAYFLIQSGRLTSEDLRYPVLNLVGALLLLISLLHSWNTPSVVIELCWISISVYGIVKIMRKRNAGVRQDAEK
jgi:peptidoglycan/LPS O-acetylase OafA/YrhL